MPIGIEALLKSVSGIGINGLFPLPLNLFKSLYCGEFGYGETVVCLKAVLFSKFIAHNARSSYLEQVKPVKGKKNRFIKDVKLPTGIVCGFFDRSNQRYVFGAGIVISFS